MTWPGLRKVKRRKKSEAIAEIIARPKGIQGGRRAQRRNGKNKRDGMEKKN